MAKLLALIGMLWWPQAPPLDSGSFSYCWPIISSILEASDSSIAAMEDGLVFLCSHASLGGCAQAPRVRIITLLLHVMQNHDRLSHQARVFLSSFSEAMSTAADAVPLVGFDKLCMGLNSESVKVRGGCLDALGKMALPAEPRVVASLWLMCHDVDDQLKQQAITIFASNAGFTQSETPLIQLFEPLGSLHEPVRETYRTPLAQRWQQGRAPFREEVFFCFF